MTTGFTEDTEPGGQGWVVRGSERAWLRCATAVGLRACRRRPMVVGSGIRLSMEQGGESHAEPPSDEAARRRLYWASIQDENGVDLTLIRANLERTPLERLRRMDQARRQWLWMRQHVRRVEPTPDARTSAD